MTFVEGFILFAFVCAAMAVYAATSIAAGLIDLLDYLERRKHEHELLR